MYSVLPGDQRQERHRLTVAQGNSLISQGSWSWYSPCSWFSESIPSEVARRPLRRWIIRRVDV